MIGIADIKKHPFRDNTTHLPRRQIDDEQRLSTDDLAWILPLLLHAHDDPALERAKINCQAHQFVTAGNVRHLCNPANADVKLFQVLKTDYWFDGHAWAVHPFRLLHRGLPSPFY